MILSAHTARQLRNASLSALYRVAYDHDVDLSDVMASINLGTTPIPSVSGDETAEKVDFSTTSISPSQPIPQAPAARTYPPVPVAVQAEEVSQAASSAIHSAAPAINPVKPTDPQAKHAAEGTLSSEPGGVQDRCESTPPTPSKPKRVTQRQRLLECHEQHPDWGAAEIAAELDMSKANVWSIASQIGIKFPSKSKATTEALRKAVKASPAKPQEPAERAGPPIPRAAPKQPSAAKSVDPKRLPIKHQVANLHLMHPTWDAARIAQEIGARLNTVQTALSDARAAAGESLSEPIPPANPQKPVAPPPVGELKTLNERVRALHEQHPNWTGRMIANELGANPNSVSVALARIRNPKAAPAPPEQPQFTGRRQMVEHYGEIAKRLGKS